MLWILLLAGVAAATTPLRPPPPSGGPLKCAPNSHLEDCPPSCPTEYCSALWSKFNCSGSSTPCHQECRCDEGFFRHEKTHQCITGKECMINCPVNEVYTRNAVYADKSCSDLVAHLYKDNHSGCMCDTGYVRLTIDPNAPCVRPEECPSQQCPCNEHWESCPNYCPDDTCKTNAPGYRCPQFFRKPDCRPGCVCDNGYLRDESGLCVPNGECPHFCNKNEHWEDCPGWCPRDSCAGRNPHYRCPELPAVPLPCYSDCVCDKGYLRNEKGVCVPKKTCPTNQTCGINEVLRPCRIVCPPQTCASIYTLYNCLQPQPCEPGCDCLPGYLRNDYGLCIRSEQCPLEPPAPPTTPECGAHRVYKKCGPVSPDTCDNINDPDHDHGDGCVDSCFCEDGYVEDKAGQCVPVDKCPTPTCLDKHEVYKRCGSGYDDTCEDYNRNENKSGGTTLPAVCVPGCYCEQGYARDENGVCVKQEDCPKEPQCFLQNEVFLTCGSSCPDTCDNYNDGGRICTKQCVRGCFCAKGYVRRQDGACVKPNKCPERCGYNEEYNFCASSCPVTCSNRLVTDQISCIQVCRERCDCISGTLRNSSGVCVPLNECSPPTCKKNEEYKKCGTACPDTCRNYDDPDRVCTDNCVEDCFCKKGYVRNDKWECVKPDQCPSVPKCSLRPHEAYSECSAHCELTCQDYERGGKACTRECRSGCACEKGYVRRADGLCVRPQECPPKPVCSLPHEEFSQCNAHCQRTCDNYKQANLVCTKICKSGCVCKKGYVRRQDGLCVKRRQCPNHSCPKNEHWETCPSSCPRDSCSSLNPNYRCPDSPNKPLTCKPDCVCNFGYLRNRNGICVPIKNCEKNQTCGVNEAYTNCKQNCPPLVCDTLAHPPKCDKRPCVKGCDCMAGYLRNEFGQCVRKEYCNEGEPVCGTNEQYYTCGSHCGDNCRSRFLPPKFCIQSCKVGCDCSPGYIRHDNGTCVPPSQCSEPECPKNSKYQKCGTSCEVTCGNFGKPGQLCSTLCKEGCFCNAGYVKNDVGECVKPKDCPTCKVNERYVDCAASYCGPRYCGDLGFPVACAGAPVGGRCNGRCICIEGYVWDEKGVCIPKEECRVAAVTVVNEPPQTTPSSSSSEEDSEEETSGENQGDRRRCGSNEHFEKCPPNCPPQNCSSIWSRYDCSNASKKCYPQCRCNDGFLRSDKTGQCLTTDECLVTCGANEHYARNIRVRVLSCSNYDQSAPKTEVVTGCTCDTGYVRMHDDGTGPCIRPEECPSDQTCGVNEEFKKCRQVCPPQTCDARLALYNCKNSTCESGCDCISGYLRNKLGQCIRAEQCDQVEPMCGVNEQYYECATHCPKTCRNRFLPPGVCIKSCKVGCDCAPGHIRHDNGTCVLPNHCSPPECTIHATYRVCGTACPRTCRNLGESQVCPLICVEGCFCNEGYVKNDLSLCVKPEECSVPKRCPKNEKYVNCVLGYCVPKTCDELGYPVACPDIAGPCEGGCVCEDGFVRDANGVCIPKEECPSCGGDFNAVSGCGNHCNNTCSDCKGPKKPCEADCPYNGCECRKGYVYDDLVKKCVTPKECTFCPKHEHWEECPSGCPRDSCAGLNPKYECPSNSTDRGCSPDCVCDKGYLRDNKGVCVPKNKCPNNQICGIKEIWKPCRILCPPQTCESLYTDYSCQVPQPCEVGCNCISGYLRNEFGECIRSEQCPAAPTPVTEPEPEPTPSPKPPIKCGPNSRYVECKSVCSNEYCPKNDSRSPVTCETPDPCRPGCVCNLNHKRNNTDGQCIVASDCPPVKCKRPNEIWDSCPSACLAESCSDVDNQPTTCNTLLLNCEPRCVCKKGYFRNTYDTCVKSESCS